MNTFFPHLTELVVREVADRGSHVLVHAATRGAAVACPACGQTSSRVHGHYRRLLHDLPAGGRPVLIALSVRRWKCANPSCTVRTFAERVGDLADRHARNTSPLRRMLEQVALAVAGRAASRLLDRLGVTVSRDTLIRLVRALPDPEIGQVTVLGVDEWARRRGRSYAAVLVNMDTHQVIDILGDDRADTFAGWLRDHPGIGVICRDRAGNFAEGAQTGAPEAIECADRWHLWANLCKAAEGAVRAHRADLQPPKTESEPSIKTVSPPPENGSQPEPEHHTAARTRERHAMINEMAGNGLTITEIARRLKLDRKTVRKFRNAATAQQLINGPRRRTRSFERFVPHLRRRVLEDGIINAAQLYAELQERGYRGSRRTVRRYLEPLRATLATPHTSPPPPTVREVTRWITSHPDHLTEDQTTQLKTILNRSPHLAALSGHVTAFAEIMTTRAGATDLKPWLAAVRAGDIPQLRSFANGIERDLDAVTNGLSLPYSSGAVEGAVTRIKALKRSRYGRANLDLLRKIILLSH